VSAACEHALEGVPVVPMAVRYEQPYVQPQQIPGHNASLAILGVFILWFGWYGFNPGSALLIIGAGDIAALAAINTTLSAAGGTVSTLLVLMVLEYMSTGHVMWDLVGSANGTLAGLVGITSACSTAEVRRLCIHDAFVCS
jgi:ammonium transporter, Amt family